MPADLPTSTITGASAKPTVLVSSQPHHVAKRVFEIESRAIQQMVNRVGEEFDRTVAAIVKSTGRIVVSGVGKSGIIGRKMAATFASTGTPSLFLHPTEAFHGDLGMVQRQDIVIAISNSGETEEVLRLLPFLRDNDNPVVAITGNENSRLAVAAQFHLDAGVDREACPLRLAPTASTTAALAMGDALAIALMSERSFEPENFARLHPGGSLGRRLLMKVGDEMVNERLPFIHAQANALEIVSAITEGGLGMAIVHYEGGFGIVTDGDLRRAMQAAGESFFAMPATHMMTKDPIAVSPDTSAHEAMEIMHRKKITALLVKAEGHVVGVFQK